MTLPGRGTADVWAPYMVWAKRRPAARYDLAGSNLAGCTLEDLPGARELVELNGPNLDGYAPLVEAIAARYGTTPEHVATGGGTSGANFLAFAALVRPGDDVLVERPAYDPLRGALRLLGARVLHFDRLFEEQWAVDPERVRRALTPATRLIVVTSPHNPSGAVIAPDVLAKLGRIAEGSRAHVLVDEVYRDAVYRDRPPPAATLGDALISTSSLTKAYGLGGLRAGWVIAAPRTAEAVRRVRDVVDGNAAFPADRLAAFAFQHIARLEARACGILAPNLERLAAFVEQREELEWVRPLGGTVAFPRVRGMTDTRPFAERLQRERETAVVPGAFFDAPAHIRIAFGCSRERLEGGLAALGAALDET